MSVKALADSTLTSTNVDIATGRCYTRHNCIDSSIERIQEKLELVRAAFEQRQSSISMYWELIGSDAVQPLAP